MSRQDFAQDWVPYRDAILTAFPGLSEDDLSRADGSTAELARSLAATQSMTPADAQNALHEVLAGPMPADAYAAPDHDNAALAESEAYIPDGEDALADDARFGDDAKADNPVGRNR